MKWCPLAVMRKVPLRMSQISVYELLKPTARIAEVCLTLIKTYLLAEFDPIDIPDIQTAKPISSVLDKELHHFLVPSVGSLSHNACHIDSGLLVGIYPVGGQWMYMI